MPQLPAGRPRSFRATVHGTVFAERAAHVDALEPGSKLLLIPDPPDQDEPNVWVHLPTGDPLGHLPPEIGAWLAPWLLRGGRARATTLKVGDAEVPSWRRLLIRVECG